MVDIKVYEDLGRSPLTGRSSMGENVRNDATYEIIKAEINKLSTVSSVGGGLPEWKVVADACEKVLRTESKDLLAGSYLAYALLESQGIQGLSAGLSSMQSMMNEHWDHLYPPVTRMAGRVGAINWLCDSLEKYFDRHREGVYDYALMSSLKALVGQIDDFLAQHGDDLSFHRAVKLVESLPVGPSPHPVQDEASPQEFALTQASKNGAPKVFPDRPAVSQASLAGVDVTHVTVNSPTIADQVSQTALAMLMKVSDYRCSQKEWKQASLYLYKIVALWSKRSQYPKQHQGQTFINPPDARVMDSLQKHYQAKNDEALLKEALSLMDAYPYWIDLIFYVHHALTDMGEAYQHPRHLLQTLTIDWLQALPMLKHYSFLGGTVPFARQETLDWLNTFDASSSVQDAVREAHMDSFLAELQKVDKRSGTDQLQSVIALQHHLKSSMKESNKIELLIKTVEVFVANREKSFLSNVVKQLADKMTHFHLVEWDSDLAKKALIAMIQAKKLLDENADQDLEQLAGIDVGASMLLQKASEVPPIAVVDTPPPSSA